MTTKDLMHQLYASTPQDRIATLRLPDNEGIVICVRHKELTAKLLLAIAEVEKQTNSITRKED